MVIGALTHDIKSIVPLAGQWSGLRQKQLNSLVELNSKLLTNVPRSTPRKLALRA